MQRLKRFSIIIIIILISTLVVLIYAPGLAGVKANMTGIGVGARGSVFHGSFAGIADDYSANFWNPAGMAFINQFNFGAMLFRLPFDQNVSYLGVIYPMSMSGYDKIGISWTGCYIGNLEARSGNSENPDYLFSSSDQTIGLSYSRKIVNRLGVGVTAKLLYHSLDDAIGVGYSFDAGFMYQNYNNNNNNIKIGLMLHDINSNLHWQTGADDQIAKIINLAGSYQWQNLIVALGIETEPKMNYLDQPKFRLSGGAEFQAMDLLSIRGGIYNNKIGFGFGLSLCYEKVNIQVNYSAVSSRISSELGHCCDIHFAWWNKNNPRSDNNSYPVGHGRIVSTESKSKSKSKLDTTTVTAKPESNRRPVFTPGDIKVVQITGDKVNVRKGPGLVYIVIGTALKHQIYPLLNEYNGWYQIDFSGVIGWIEGSLVVVR